MPFAQLIGTESCRNEPFFFYFWTSFKKREKEKSSRYKRLELFAPFVPGICHAVVLKLSRHCRGSAEYWDFSTRLGSKMKESWLRLGIELIDISASVYIPIITDFHLTPKTCQSLRVVLD